MANVRKRPSEVFGERLTETRAARGSISQAELARRMTEAGYPMDKAAVLRVEKGKRGLSLDEALGFCAVLNVAPAYMLTPPDSTFIALTDKFGMDAEALREWLQFALWNWTPAPDEDHFRAGLRDRFENVAAQLAQALVDANRGGDKVGTQSAVLALARAAQSYEAELGKYEADFEKERSTS
jgi:transcriptional regulator with XRE-family HTH domain